MNYERHPTAERTVTIVVNEAGKKSSVDLSTDDTIVRRLGSHPEMDYVFHRSEDLARPLLIFGCPVLTDSLDVLGYGLSYADKPTRREIALYVGYQAQQLEVELGELADSGEDAP